MGRRVLALTDQEQGLVANAEGPVNARYLLFHTYKLFFVS